MTIDDIIFNVSRLILTLYTNFRSKLNKKKRSDFDTFREKVKKTVFSKNSKLCLTDIFIRTKFE